MAMSPLPPISSQHSRMAGITVTHAMSDDESQTTTLNFEPPPTQSEKSNPPKDPFEVTLELSELPTSLPSLQKWICLLIICSSALCLTCASSMSTSTLPHIEKHWHIGSEVATLSLSLYIIGLGCGPLLFGGMSEFLGRNLMYRLSFVTFFIFTFPVAFANNIAVHLVFRFVTGFCGSAFLSLGGGSIADMFMGPDVATPVAIYSLSPFIGPILGPILSGFINQYTNWRWTYYVLLMWIFVQCIGVFFLPETYMPTLTNRKAARLRAETGDKKYFSKFETSDRTMLQTIGLSITRPFSLMIYDLMISLLNLWTSLSLAIVYVAFAVYPIVFEEVHGFTQSQEGLAFIGLGIGMVSATASQPLWNALDRRNTAKYAALGQKPPPECALYMGMLAAILSPVGLFMFAFTVYREVHWIVPIIVIAPFGASVVFAFTSTFTFFVHTYRPMAASVLASNAFCRSTLAGALPLAARPMFRAMTNTGALAFLAGVMTLLAPLPFVFFKFGPKIRKNSRYAV